MHTLSNSLISLVLEYLIDDASAVEACLCCEFALIEPCIPQAVKNTIISDAYDHDLPRSMLDTNMLICSMCAMWSTNPWFIAADLGATYIIPYLYETDYASGISFTTLTLECMIVRATRHGHTEFLRTLRNLGNFVFGATACDEVFTDHFITIIKEAIRTADHRTVGIVMEHIFPRNGVAGSKRAVVEALYVMISHILGEWPAYTKDEDFERTIDFLFAKELNHRHSRSLFFRYAASYGHIGASYAGCHSAWRNAIIKSFVKKDPILPTLPVAAKMLQIVQYCVNDKDPLHAPLYAKMDKLLTSLIPPPKKKRFS